MWFSCKELVKMSIALDLTASYRRVANAAGKYITVLDSISLPFSKQAAIMAGLGGLGGMICSHTKYSVQDSICLQVLRRQETQSAASTPLSAPWFLSPCPPHLHLEQSKSEFWRSLFRKREIFCTAKTSFKVFDFLWGFWPKSQKYPVPLQFISVPSPLPLQPKKNFFSQDAIFYANCLFQLSDPSCSSVQNLAQ